MHTDIIVLLGPPGSGKGSLSTLCVKRLGSIQFSTGNLCRQHIADRTEIGKKIDFIIKSGKLISDSLIMEMVQLWLESWAIPGRKIIFDGLPRTKAQASALNELYKTLKVPVRTHIVRLSIPDDRIVERLQTRALCSNKDCQAVYSLHKDSTLNPVKEMTCNECSSSLIRRAEDEEMIARERLRIYHEHEKEIISFYESVSQQIHMLNVEKPLEEAYNQLISMAGFSR